VNHTELTSGDGGPTKWNSSVDGISCTSLNGDIAIARQYFWKHTPMACAIDQIEQLVSTAKQFYSKLS